MTLLVNIQLLCCFHIRKFLASYNHTMSSNPHFLNVKEDY
jgi:hypothetical protein